MARQRLTRKAIRQPDHFISGTVQVLNWVKSHAAYLLYAGLGIVVVVAFIVGWSAWQRHRYQKAEALLYEAVKLLKTSAAGQAADKTKHDMAVQQLQDLTRDYGTTPAAALAHWQLGHQYYAQGDYGLALAAYEKARQLLGKDADRLLPALVDLNIGYAQEAGGGCEDAIASFEKVLQSSAGWMHGEAFLGIGRCYESSGAIDQANAVYTRALADETVSGDARQRLEQRQTHLAIMPGGGGGHTETVPPEAK